MLRKQQLKDLKYIQKLDTISSLHTTYQVWVLVAGKGANPSAVVEFLSTAPPQHSEICCQSCNNTEQGIEFVSLKKARINEPRYYVAENTKAMRCEIGISAYYLLTFDSGWKFDHWKQHQECRANWTFYALVNAW